MGKYQESKNAYMRRWRAENPEKANAVTTRSKYKQLYGINLEDVELMLSHQRGVCAICKSREVRTSKSGKIKSLSVDHNHTTGVVRGLLCGACNQIIGIAKDNPAILRAAAMYLDVSNRGFSFLEAAAAKSDQPVEE